MTNPPDPRVIEEFARRKKAQLIATVPFVIFLIPVIVMRDRSQQTVLGMPLCVVGPVFLVGVIGMLIFSFSNWRCPACNAYLGKSWAIRFCPRCGATLAP